VALVEAFGAEIVTEGGEIDRRKLGAIVFADPAQRQRLQDIVWPRMKEMMRARLDELRAAGTQVVVIEAAVLLEAGWQDLTDEVWVVTVPEPIAMQRLIARNGFSEDEARSRIRAQLSNEERAQHADAVIDNSGSIEDARVQVRQTLAAPSTGAKRS
jgi:dephospho-CoA kinase